MMNRPTITEALVAEAQSGRDVGHIQLRGRLDRDGEATLAAAYTAASASEPSRIEVDFGAVDYINSTGIALIVRLLADARRDGRAVEARGLTEHYQEIFRITRLSDLMTIVDDEGGNA